MAIRLTHDAGRDGLQVRAVGGLDGLAEDPQTLSERQARHVLAAMPQDVEDEEPQVGPMTVLDELCVRGAGRQGRHGCLEGMGHGVALAQGGAPYLQGLALLLRRLGRPRALYTAPIPS
jgi:hypothetical protein